MHAESRALIERACAARGFDLCAWGRVGDYNRELAALPDYWLPSLGSPSHCVLLVGNTRALWPLLLDALAADPALRADPHPLDRYTRQCMQEVAELASEQLGCQHALRLSADPVPEAVAIQRLAQLTGLAQLAPCNLSIHPEHGLWISLRAAIVLALEGPTKTAAAPRPCERCAERPCIPPFERALAADQKLLSLPNPQRVAAAGDLWLAVRKACPVGVASRFCQAQQDYHYTKDREALLRLVTERQR